MKDQDKPKEQLISELEDLREQGVERKRAEEALQESIRAGEANPEELLPTAETKRIIHDLRVHQIELEIQTRELRHTQNELEVSRARYFDLYDLAPVGYFTLSENGMILEANLTAAILLGVARGDFLKRPLRRFILPEDRDIFDKHHKQLFATHSHQVCELRMLRKDTPPFWVRLEAKEPQDDENGMPVYRAVIGDITGQKQAEEALQKAHEELEQRVKERTAELAEVNENLAASEAKYRNLIETTGTGYLILDEEGRVVDANVEYVRLTGHRSLGEIMGRGVVEWTASHDAERNAHEVQKCLQKKTVRQLEVDYFGPDGKVTPIEINASVIATRQGKRIVSLCRDITERKEFQEALHHTLDQLQAVYNAIVEGLLITDIETKHFVRVNSSMCRMLGYSEEELVALSIKDIHPPEEVPNDFGRFQAAAEGRVSINENRPVLRKDGSVFYADITVHRVFYDERPCLLALFRDITERRQTEDALNRQHELEVSEAFARNRAIELADADRHKDEFLAMLAHELRNPLAPIRSGIDVLRVVPPDGERAKQILDMMEEQVHNLVRLIDDLLDVSRSTRGKLELRRQRVAVSKIIAAAIHTAQPLIRASGHELAMTQAQETLHIHGDPTRLTQIVSNLLNNAAKYTHRGGKIVLTTERIRNEVAIRVKDNGSGIASEMLPRIFEMFVQADNSLARTHGGLGIGLTLVKSLVEMHGGSVEAASDGLGKGSEFTVRLPILQASDVGHEEATDFPDVTRSFPCHKILVVDDVRPIASMLATLLRHFGQNVRSAVGGVEALAMIEEEKPDLVLSDVSMPEMTGYELAQEIRRRPEWNDICLVAQSGYGQESDKKRSTDAGFNSHMVKPVGKVDLERLLASLVYLRCPHHELGGEPQFISRRDS